VGGWLFRGIFGWGSGFVVQRFVSFGLGVDWFFERCWDYDEVRSVMRSPNRERLRY